MYNLGDISIVELELNDAISLNLMILNNSDRFQRFFPMTLKENMSLDLTKAYILMKIDLIRIKEEYSLGIRDNKTSDIIGLIIIKNIDRIVHDAELAYCIDKNYGTKGIMTKVVAQICRFAFETERLQSLYILAHETNIASVRVAEKNDFNWIETKLKSHTPPDEEALDMEYFLKNKN